MADEKEKTPPPGPAEASPGAPVEEVFVNPSELTRDDLIKMIDEAGRSYFQRLVDMFKGLRQPKDSLDYKKAIIELQRLGAPLGAILLTVIFLVVMSFVSCAAEETTPPTIITEMVQEAEEQQLEEPEEPPPPPEEIRELTEEMEITDVTVDIQAPPTTSAVQSPAPAPVDAVAITPSPIKMPGVYASRSTGVRGDKIGAYGLGQTEALVYGFLRYLKMRQNKDGSWDSGTVSTGATSLALLCFLAHGETPGKSDEFGDTVEKAIRWLLNDQIKTEGEIDHRNAPRKGGSHAWRRGEIGYFKGRDTCNYAHFLAVYALSEAYAMTQIPDIKDALELAIPHILNGQNAQGGWYYNMDASCPVIDTSYASWAVQALKAAKLAHVGDQAQIITALKKAANGLKVLYHSDGSFGYTTRGNERNAYNGLTAPCVLALQMLDQGDSAEARKSLDYMKNWGPTFDKKKFKSNSSPQYYCYYLSQVRFNQGEKHPQWLAWHNQQKRLYTAAAITIPKEASGYKDHEGKPQYVTFWPRKGGKHKFGTEGSPIADDVRLKGLSDTRNGARLGIPVEQLISQDAATSEWEGKNSDIISSCFTALQLMVYYRNSPLSKGALTSIEQEAEVEVTEGGADEVELDFGDL